MKDLFAPRVLVVLASMAFAAAAASAQSAGLNLVRDGDFEQGVVKSFSYRQSETIDGDSWYCGPSLGVDNGYILYDLNVDRDPSEVISGAASVTISGRLLQQNVPTLVGKSYLLSFDAYAGLPYSSTFAASFGSQSQTFTIPHSYDPLGAIVPRGYVFHFFLPVTATSTLTTLSFGTTFVGDNTLYLDNVSVTPIVTPETSTVLALGLGAATFLRRRRR